MTSKRQQLCELLLGKVGDQTYSLLLTDAILDAVDEHLSRPLLNLEKVPVDLKIGGFEQRFDGDALATELDAVARQILPLAPKEAGRFTTDPLDPYAASNLIANAAHHVRRLKKSEDAIRADERKKLLTTGLGQLTPEERDVMLSKFIAMSHGAFGRVAAYFKHYTQAEAGSNAEGKYVRGLVNEVSKLLAIYKVP